jgi:hypothetical protein
MYFLRIILLLSIWPLHLAHGQELLFLSFTTENPGEGKMYSTAATHKISVAEGHQVLLQKSKGRDYRLSSPDYGWSPLQLEQIPTETTLILVTPQRQGDKLLLVVNYIASKRDDKLSYSGTVPGEIGQWIPLLQQTLGNAGAGSKIYTTDDPSKQLWVKVDSGS